VYADTVLDFILLIGHDEKETMNVKILRNAIEDFTSDVFEESL
jgi:hypothetical protein